MFRFEKLEVWQDGRKFVKEIYLLSDKFPNNEKFCLIDQIRRAAVSIVLNIAEGSDRKSDIEFKRFLRMAITSTEEVVSVLYIALDLKYIDDKTFEPAYLKANQLVAKINALINAI